MPQTPSRPTSPAANVYSLTARKFHWYTALLVAIMFPLGVYMTYRGNTLNVWDSLTNSLYSAHKLIGFIILWLVLARLIYRLRHGAPADEPTLAPWQKVAAHITHWSLYGLLLLTPLLGWLGVSRYGARDIFGLFSLPPLAPVDQDASKTIFWLHEIGAKLIFVLLLAHIGGAIFHHVIRKDGVLRRMLPNLKSKS